MSENEMHGHEAGQDRPGAPHTTQAEGDGPEQARNDSLVQGEHGATGSGEANASQEADGVRTSDPAGRASGLEAAEPGGAVSPSCEEGEAVASRAVPVHGLAESPGKAPTQTYDSDQAVPWRTAASARDRAPSSGAAPTSLYDMDEAATLRAAVPLQNPAESHGRVSALTCNPDDAAAASQAAVSARDRAEAQFSAPTLPRNADEVATARTAAGPQDLAEQHGPACASPDGKHETAPTRVATSCPGTVGSHGPPSSPPEGNDEVTNLTAAGKRLDAAEADGPAPAADKEDEVPTTALRPAPRAAAVPGSQASLSPSSEDAVTIMPVAGLPHATEADSPAPPSPYDEDEVTDALVAAPAPAAAAPDGPAHAPPYDEDEVTTVLVAASSPAAEAPDGPSHARPYDEDEVTTVLVTASSPAAGGPDDPAHPRPYDEDEVTTVLVAASSPAAEGPDSPAHLRPYDEDEVTTVLVAAFTPAAAERDDQVHTPVHDADEVNTVSVAASSGAAEEPDGPACAHPYDGDEVTTVLVSPVEDPAGPQNRTPAPYDSDEVTTVMVGAAGPRTGEPASSPPARVATGPADEPASSEDDVTTVIAAAEPDERTTVVQTEPAALGPAFGAANRHTPGQPSASRTDADAAYPEAGAASAASPAAHAEEPVTEVIQVPRPPGTVASDPDRHWFDVAFSQFMTALRQDEAGRPRPHEERHALAAAARDTITRVAMQTVRSGEGWATDTVLQPDQLLANTYTVRSLIARGGIGEIYRVRHRDLKTEHAIKILLPHYALDATMQTLMLDEARLLRRVQHEAVVRAQDLLRDADGRPMLVMDYIRGRTLASRLRESQLSAPEVLALTRRLAEGLSAIHATGIVHQDISPDNIILAEDSCATATIIDFGLARVIGAGRDTHRNLDFAGKYSWSSPEQLSGRPAAVDARSDLYSLGLILAAATRGYRLEMGNDLESARAARRTVPSLSGVEEPMRGLLARLLAPAPDARLASASEIHGMLETKRVSWWRGWLGM